MKEFSYTDRADNKWIWSELVDDIKIGQYVTS